MEINSGGFYLRALRGDERVDDLPALRTLDPGAGPDALRRYARGWQDEDLLSWAVCVQTDVQAVAIVECAVEATADGGVPRARVTGREVPGAAAGTEGALEAGTAAVRRFAAGALGAEIVD